MVILYADHVAQIPQYITLAGLVPQSQFPLFTQWRVFGGVLDLSFAFCKKQSYLKVTLTNEAQKTETFGKSFGNQIEVGTGAWVG